MARRAQAVRNYHDLRAVAVARRGARYALRGSQHARERNLPRGSQLPTERRNIDGAPVILVKEPRQVLQPRSNHASSATKIPVVFRKLGACEENSIFALRKSRQREINHRCTEIKLPRGRATLARRRSIPAEGGQLNPEGGQLSLERYELSLERDERSLGVPYAASRRSQVNSSRREVASGHGKWGRRKSRVSLCRA